MLSIIARTGVGPSVAAMVTAGRVPTSAAAAATATTEVAAAVVPHRIRRAAAETGASVPRGFT